MAAPCGTIVVMKTALDCVPCLIRQSLDASRTVSDDPLIHEEAMRDMLRWTADEVSGSSPVLLGQRLHRRLRVLTGVAVWTGREMRSIVSTTAVRFRDIDPDEARAYWHSGEPLDKAGAYAIQGRGGVFVEELSGSYTGVVGLPVFETAQLLGEAGINVWGQGPVHSRGPGRVEG